jgi:hypothetical protein
VRNASKREGLVLVDKRPGRKPSELFYRKEADAFVAKIREEAGLVGSGGLVVEYVCRNNPMHRTKQLSVFFDKERYCVFCECLMAVNVVKEPTCTEPQ